MHHSRQSAPALKGGGDNAARIASVGREPANDLRAFLSVGGTCGGSSEE